MVIQIFVGGGGGGGGAHAVVLQASVVFAGFAPVQLLSATTVPSSFLHTVGATCVPHPHDTLHPPNVPDCQIYMTAGVHILVTAFHDHPRDVQIFFTCVST